MPDDAQEKHTPAPWKVVDEKDRTIDTTEDSHIGKLVRRRSLLSVFLGRDEGIPETLRANARRIVACVNFCEGVSTADLEESLERGDTLTNEDEAIVALLNEVGKERNDLRDENERLKERVAELEKALGPLKHYNEIAAREAARRARKVGQVEAAAYLDDACDHITRALRDSFNWPPEASE